MNADALTSEELSILQHTLGLNAHGQGESYRNHYVASPGHPSTAALKRLVSRGLMGLSPRPRFLHDDDSVYHVTAEGRSAVIEFSPPPPKIPRAERRYRYWRENFDGYTFAEFLRQGLYKGMPAV